MSPRSAVAIGLFFTVPHDQYWVHVFFSLLAQELKHSSMSVKLELDMEQCHEERAKDKTVQENTRGVLDGALVWWLHYRITHNCKNVVTVLKGTVTSEQFATSRCYKLNNLGRYGFRRSKECFWGRVAVRFSISPCLNLSILAVSQVTKEAFL